MSKKITKDIIKKLDKGIDKFFDNNQNFTESSEKSSGAFPISSGTPNLGKVSNDNFMNMADRSDGGPFFDDEDTHEFEEHIQSMKVTPYSEAELKEIEETAHDPKNPKRGCTDKHPPLSFEVDGKIGTIYGAGCAYPIAEADLFISLDEHAPVFAFEQPWYDNTLNQQHIRYFIKDFSVPDDSSEFDACVDIAIDALSEGKTVHVGCLSGHGRTGMFLSTVVQKMIGEELKLEGISAIDYVRDNYCAKVVETLEQVMFLHSNFDIDIPRKEFEDVKKIKKMFKEQIGVSLDEVIALGEYDACTDVILELERQILLTKSFPRIPKPISPFPVIISKPKSNPIYSEEDFEKENIPRFDKSFFTKKHKI